MTVNKNIRVGGAIVTGVFLIGTAIFFNARNSSATVDVAALVVATEPRGYQETKDSNNNGIADWEESLPSATIKGGTGNQNNGNLATTTTITDTFAKNFFSEYISKNSGDTSMTPEAKQAFLERSLQKAFTEVTDTPLTLKDVVVKSASDTESVRAYGNAVAEALMRYPGAPENEIFIFQRGIEAGSDEELQGLDPTILSYKNSIRDIQAIPVPQPLLRDHLALLNSMQAIHTTLVTMRIALVDPLPALARFQGYMPEVQKLQGSLASLKNDFGAFGISFSEDEKGSLFLQF